MHHRQESTVEIDMLSIPVRMILNGFSLAIQLTRLVFVNVSLDSGFPLTYLLGATLVDDPFATRFHDSIMKEHLIFELQIAKNIEHTTSLIANNDKFKAQIQEKGFAVAALKNELRKLTGNSVNTKFAKPSILGKPVLQPHRNQFVVRQPTAFKSERPRISKPRFASQVDVNNDLSKPVTTHHLPKGRESAPAKPHHMIAPSSSRYSSNDIVHNHYLEEAKKKTHEHSRIPRNFSDSKHFVCSTCQKCVFNANHDECVLEYLSRFNPRASAQNKDAKSHKTTKRYKPPRSSSKTSDHKPSETWNSSPQHNGTVKFKVVPKVVP
ncbi:hypothetical protein Tco_0280900 [Tanacetum coccineum]